MMLGGSAVLAAAMLGPDEDRTQLVMGPWY